ncbi:MAG: hypothetical protein V4507_05450 [Verrucomicrobiota bacterium]
MGKIDNSFLGGRKIAVEEWVKGETFQRLCDETYQNGDDLSKGRAALKTVFVEMGDIRSFMESASRVKNRFILISHNGDGRVLNREKREIDISPARRPSNVVAWFSTNVCTRSYGIFSIPLGFENSKWFPEQNKQRQMELFQKKERTSRSLIYLNFNKYNNLPQREGLYEKFSSYSWATVHDGKNGKDYESYLSEMISNDFVLCPEGNGPDTHRTWEALYLGTIPILKKHILHQDWKTELPIVWVDSWDQIDDQFLMEKKIEIRSRAYQWDVLKISSWNEKIQKIRKQSGIERIFSFGLKESERIARTRWERDYFRRRE